MSRIPIWDFQQLGKANDGKSSIGESGTIKYLRYEILSKEEFLNARKELEHEREQVQEAICETRRRIIEKQELLEKQYMSMDELMKFQGYDKIDREMLEKNLDVVYVYDDGRVKIVWKV